LGQLSELSLLLTVDTSVLIAVAADEPHKPALIEAARGADLVGPASVPAEIGNALSAMFKRGRISLEEARRVLAAYQSIPIRLIDLDLGRAVALAKRLGIYAYDAYVIDCALSLDSPLLSLDGGQREAAQRAGVRLHAFDPASGTLP
jgi:predicted nucleic acid-binding protein